MKIERIVVAAGLIVTGILGLGPTFAAAQTPPAGAKTTPTGTATAVPSATPSATPKPTAIPAATPASAETKAPAAGATTQPIDDWAKDVIREDPLATKSKVTAEDLRRALADPKTSDFVLERHFARAEMPPAEREALLRGALDHKSILVRRQAARELSTLKLLDAAVSDELLRLVPTADAELRRSVVVSLRNVELPWKKVSESYWKAVLEALTSSDPAAAATALSRVVGHAQKKPDMTVEIPGTSGHVAPTMGKGPLRNADVRHPERELDKDRPEMVRVYYGTNREVLPKAVDPRYLLLGLPVLFAYFLYRMVRSVRRTSREPTAWRIVKTTFGTALLLGLSFGAVLVWNASLRERLNETTGPAYGGHRAANGGVYYGYCDVTIPKTHKIGMVEKPIFGLEDENEHVMLRHIAQMKQDAFFDQVRGELAARDLDRRNCFVFVHGYNVTFEKAALRTAQIHYDLKFSGVPMFYSWPSRANVRSYFSDRNEIFYSYEHVKQFLLDTAERTGAKRIHVIAHSMGADAVSRAILMMGDRGKIFDQIVLAAPDIDADVFRRQIAPQMQKLANRTTLYCSRNDLALHASYAFNDSVRLGDSSRGIVVLEGLDTIDASDIDTDLLGHSYYGDCTLLLTDVGLLLDKNLSPVERRLSSHLSEKLSYWTFTKPPDDAGQ